jgi:hypothetical protein
MTNTPKEIVLYKNAKGYNVVTGSYSSRDSFKYCARRFQLNRIDGWNQKEQRASALFGKAVEAGWQWYEESNREAGTGVKKFIEEWEKVYTLPNSKDLTYTDVEVDWASLLRAGIEMERLYEIRVPSLPISPQTVFPKTRFQVQMRKKIFPGSELDVLENVAYIDMITYPVWNHSMLAKIASSENERRPQIVDCKTSGVSLEMILLSLDPQLIEYAWQSGIHDAAFLNFVKANHSISKRDRVTLLEAVEGIPAGTELFVLGTEKIEKPKKPPKTKKVKAKKGEDLVETLVEIATPVLEAPPVNVGEITKVFLGDLSALKQLGEATKGMQGNSLIYKETAAKFFQARFVIAAKPEQVTKQRLQFASTRISETSIKEMGQSIGRTTVEMVRAHNDGEYLMNSGIRFPNGRCVWCEMRGICADIPELRDELLTRAGDDWTDEKDVD